MSQPPISCPNSSLIGALTLTAAFASACTADADPVASVAASGVPAEYEASYEEADCPDPNVPGFPAVDLGPEYTCGYLTVPQTRSDPVGPVFHPSAGGFSQIARPVPGQGSGRGPPSTLADYPLLCG